MNRNAWLAVGIWLGIVLSAWGAALGWSLFLQFVVLDIEGTWLGGAYTLAVSFTLTWAIWRAGPLMYWTRDAADRILERE